MVASRIIGKTLLVPVESEVSGTPSQACATSRLVPSPPSTMIPPTPRSTMRAVASSVSAGEPSIGMSRNSTSGHTWPSGGPRPIARFTRSAMPLSSGIM